MNLGKNEKIFILLCKKYPQLNTNSIRILMKIILKKNIRMDNLLHSLIIKEIINPKSKKLKKFGKNLDIDEKLPNIDNNILSNLKNFEKPIVLGKMAKSILYLIYKTKKSSLKFIVSFFGEPSVNIYAILNRLETKDLVLSYHSRIKFKNNSGKRFNPKYYSLTNLGITWVEIHKSDIKSASEIDDFIAQPQNQISDLILNFENDKT